MSNSTGLYPSVRVDGAGAGIVSEAGGLLLTRTVQASGLGAGLSAVLGPWRKPLAVHDPGKIITDLALSLAMGGDCLADVDRLRAQPAVFGPVASDPTVSRLVRALSTAAPAKALSAVNAARAAARAHVWSLAGEQSPIHGATAGDPLIVDLDATLITAHSDKEDARPTWKKGYGFHPLCAFVDHGGAGTGEPLAVLLRPGNAGSNTATDHITVTGDALKQLPAGFRSGRKVMVRTDSAGGTQEFVHWLAAPRRNLA
ncbi:IS1380 family transposase, partial [Tersicoccus phoenicis]